jgi:hypothetical protein
VPNTRQPLARRAAAFLDKHGLSFGDALNLSLFVLTLISLCFAYAGVKVATVTLNESMREEGEHKTEEQRQEAEHKAEEQRQEAEHKAERQDEAAEHHKEQQEQGVQRKLAIEEAERQLDELKSSTGALDQARTLLGRQAQTLQDLQAISTKQLEDLDNAERRAHAAPDPGVTLRCGSQLIAHLGNIEGISDRDPSGLRTNASFDASGLVYCGLNLENNGDAEFLDLEVQVSALCEGEDPDPPAIPLIVEDKDGIYEPPLKADLLLVKMAELPPMAITHRLFRYPFAIANVGSWKSVEVLFSLDARNYTPLLRTGFISIQPSTGPVKIWQVSH